MYGSISLKEPEDTVKLVVSLTFAFQVYITKTYIIIFNCVIETYQLIFRIISHATVLP